MKRALAAVAALLVATPAAAQPQLLGNRWDSDQPSTFNHVLQGTPGRKQLRIDATTDAGGGVTVAVYPRAADGGRGRVRILFVIATTQGNSRTAAVTLPGLEPGAAVARLPVVVVVENASGRRNTGEYTLTLSP